MKWTHVSKNLPDIGAPVLLTDGKSILVGERVNAEYRVDKPWRWVATGVDGYELEWDFDFYGSKDPVTHWMTLPALPDAKGGRA
jgi:hypothetical protein